jgi:uncharacterized membrane protein YphA (DoxX/SURF4 family)
MENLLTIHSILRWAIVIIAVLAIIKFAIGWAGNSSFKGMDRGLSAGFSGLMDAQVLLGFVYMLWSGFTDAGFPGYRWLHMIIMIAAAALAHVPSRLKSLTDKLRFQYSLLIIIGTLVLVFVGVMMVAGR